MPSADRIPMPESGSLLNEANSLLRQAGLPICDSLEPVADGDTTNPTVIGHAPTREYVIKTIQPRPLRGVPLSLSQQCTVANWFGEERNLPVPRHLCSATNSERLPLIIMDRSPGEQLRLALSTASPATGRAIARDWGRCLARLHTTETPDWLTDLTNLNSPAIRDRTETPMDDGAETEVLMANKPWMAKIQGVATGEWGTERVFQAFIEAIDVMRVDRSWLPELRSTIKQYMEDRVGDFVSTPWGVMKRDTDTRDFLVSTEPEDHISAMLDWEQVYRGFVLYDCLQAYLRLRANGQIALWAHLCEGYEDESGRPLRQGAAVEYCLMCRCWVADNPYFDEVILDLVNGASLPFAKRD